ncbi:MAG: peptidase M14 [Flavobacteriaceae bacterium]|nr:peptidase M14 [Flavobacteriaceae bacterium]
MSLHNIYREDKLQGRYISNNHITPILHGLPTKFKLDTIGYSVELSPIYSVSVGEGPTKILMWSQMHGNESTTTKALFDLFKYIEDAHSTILRHCSLVIIPILNPDGAEDYKRLNAADVDLNRDSQRLSQPESKLLRMVFDNFKPDYCFNLHGQRTIFSAGSQNKPATISFLSPAEDENRSVTPTRQKAMNLIVAMAKYLKPILKDQIGRYNDSFNLNCVGDTFQSLGVPTVLFEAGHYANDYHREHTRFYIFEALKAALNYISGDLVTTNSEGYLDIPENKKLFYDLIIRNAKVNSDCLDIAIQYHEEFDGKTVKFRPKIEKISDLKHHFGHREINANGGEVLKVNGKNIKLYEVLDSVQINNELFSIKLPNI